MFSLWAAVGGDGEMGKWCVWNQKEKINRSVATLIMEVMITTWDLGIMHYY